MNDRLQRHESLKRLRVGLTGLSGIVLLIGLVNIVVDKARDAGPRAGAEATPALNATDESENGSLREPLAELGATPAAEKAPPADNGIQAVPDLEPDPRLKTPMDRETRPAVRP